MFAPTARIKIAALRFTRGALDGDARWRHLRHPAMFARSAGRAVGREAQDSRQPGERPAHWRHVQSELPRSWLRPSSSCRLQRDQPRGGTKTDASTGRTLIPAKASVLVVGRQNRDGLRGDWRSARRRRRQIAVLHKIAAKTARTGLSPASHALATPIVVRDGCRRLTRSSALPAMLDLAVGLTDSMIGFAG
jgi:hypothetical protein